MTIACSALPVAIVAAANTEVSTGRLAKKLPIHTPGHTRRPRTGRPASAIPEDGQMGVAYPGGIATARASLARP